MTKHDAQKVTERIRGLASNARESLEKMQRYLSEAKDGDAWAVLGYSSWTAYVADVLGKEPLHLTREQRQVLVGYLVGEGMSTRAIAPVVGTSDFTVREDIKAGARNLAPAPEPREVTGLDGKTYPTPCIEHDAQASAFTVPRNVPESL